MILSFGVIHASVLCSQHKAQLASSWVTVSEDSGVCSKCAKCDLGSNNQKTKGCCKDKTEVLKLDLDQSVAESFTKLSAQQFVMLRTLIPVFLFDQSAESSDDDFIAPNTIPLGRPVPINVLNCVYRI